MRHKSTSFMFCVSLNSSSIATKIRAYSSVEKQNFQHEKSNSSSKLINLFLFLIHLQLTIFLIPSNYHDKYIKKKELHKKLR